MILLDTHAAVWLAMNDRALGKESRSIAAAALADSLLSLCAISFWEIALLVAKGRMQISTPPSDLRRQLLDEGVVELPLTGDIALSAVMLEGLPGDPADRFIAATAIAHDATLVTADAALLRWRHKLRRQNAAK